MEGTMSKTEIPQILGFTPVIVHDCIFCNQPIRIAYERQTAKLEPYRETYYTHFLEFPWAGGVLLIERDHFEKPEPFWFFRHNFNGCGFVVPTANESTTESFIQQIYTSLFFRRDKPPKRIIRFDVDAFLRAPFVSYAEPRNPDHPKLRLIASRFVMISILTTKKIPAIGSSLPQLTDEQVRQAPEEFLRIIRAETVNIR